MTAVVVDASVWVSRLIVKFLNILMILSRDDISCYRC